MSVTVTIRKRNAARFSVGLMGDAAFTATLPENVRLRFKWTKACRSATEAKAEAEGMVAWLRVYGINSTILRVQEA